MKTYDKILSFENSFYKELYEDGIKQRTQLNSKFTPTVTILSAEIGSTIWLVFEFIKNIETYQDILKAPHLYVFISLIITIFFLISVVFNFIRCFTEYNFSYPDPSKAKNYVDSNKSYLKDYTEEEVLNNIIENISEVYANIAISNNKETNKHSDYLNKCYIGIIAALGFMGIDLVLILFLQNMIVLTP